MGDWVRLGDRAIRVARPSGSSAAAIVAAARAWPGVTDVVVARDDVAVYFAGRPAVDDGAVRMLAGLGGTPMPARTVELPVIYDGPDLADVARHAGIDQAQVVRLHVEGTYQVDTMGFAPGFAYLVGLDARLHVPRRATPRLRVPAGSVAIAGGYTGVYPFESPGGWHLIGRVTGVDLFGPHGPLLHLGDRVRFVP